MSLEITRVFENDGRGVADLFQAGAQIALDTAITEGCGYALLTDGSPTSVQPSYIVANMMGEQRPGLGIVASRLKRTGIKVFAQHQIQQLADTLSY